MKQKKSNEKPNIRRLKQSNGAGSARRSEKSQNVNYAKVMSDSQAPLGEEKMPLRNKSLGSIAMKQSRLRSGLASTHQAASSRQKNQN